MRERQIQVWMSIKYWRAECGPWDSSLAVMGFIHRTIQLFIPLLLIFRRQVPSESLHIQSNNMQKVCVCMCARTRVYVQCRRWKGFLGESSPKNLPHSVVLILKPISNACLNEKRDIFLPQHWTTHICMKIRGNVVKNWLWETGWEIALSQDQFRWLLSIWGLNQNNPSIPMHDYSSSLSQVNMCIKYFTTNTQK